MSEAPVHPIPPALAGFFAAHRRAALCFSGGTDSVYLLWAAHRAGAGVRPYFVKSPFQPEFEHSDASRAADLIGAPLAVIEADTLSDENVASNGPDRCYHCKRVIFGLIAEAARRDGYDLLLDGTNASDDPSDRPGARAAGELGVLSPLREAGLTKQDIRALSRAAGLFTWNKPAYACLATRVPTGEPITREDLARIERAEDALAEMGFRDFRARLFHSAARLQFTERDMGRAIERRDEITRELSPLFGAVLLDLEPRAGEPTI